MAIKKKLKQHLRKPLFRLRLYVTGTFLFSIAFKIFAFTIIHVWHSAVLVHCQFFVLVMDTYATSNCGDVEADRDAVITGVKDSCSVAVDVFIYADLNDDIAILATVRTKKQLNQIQRLI